MLDNKEREKMSFADRVLYDKDIREPLFFFLEETYGKVRILEEKRTGSARVDVVMITPQYLYGIEIKSDADSYTRLKKQVKNYDWHYDRNIIVVGSTHAAHVREHVPDTWGIISVEIRRADFFDASKPAGSPDRRSGAESVELDKKGRVDFYVIREATDNPKVKDKRKITILWRTELNRLLEKNKLPKYLRKSKQFVQEKLMEKVPGEILWPQAYDELFERDYNTIGQEIENFRRERRANSRIQICNSKTPGE